MSRRRAPALVASCGEAFYWLGEVCTPAGRRVLVGVGEDGGLAKCFCVRGGESAMTVVARTQHAWLRACEDA